MIENIKNNDRQPEGVLTLRTQAMPKDCNANGDIFGGWIISQMDIGGGLLACEIAQGRVVTITIDKMIFKRPVHVGEIICVHAKMIHLGNSSMNIKVEAWAKGLLERYFLSLSLPGISYRTRRKG